MKQKIIIFTIIIFLYIPGLHSEVLGKLKISVIDSNGKPVPGVKITLVDTQTKSNTFILITKKNGVAIKNGINNHIFDVTLEKEGYQPCKTQMRVPPGDIWKEEVTLKTTEEVIKEREKTDPHAQAVKALNEAASFMEEKRYEKALELLKKSISLDENIYQAHYYSGVILYELGKYKEAVKALNKVLVIKRDFDSALRLLAAAHEKLGNKKEADKYTELAQQVGGKTSIDAFNEGSRAFNEGKTDKAIRAFEEAIKLDEKFADAYYRLGLCYLNKGVNEKAIACFKKYIQLKPKGKDTDTAKSIIETFK
jgi:tetratricopeptide (TPR) repeat protein